MTIFLITFKTSQDECDNANDILHKELQNKASEMNIKIYTHTDTINTTDIGRIVINVNMVTFDNDSEAMRFKLGLDNDSMVERLRKQGIRTHDTLGEWIRKQS